MKKTKKIITSVLIILCISTPVYAGWLHMLKANIKGELIGNSFTVSVYDNYGNNITNVHGKKVCPENRWIEEPGWDDTSYSLSSVITNVIDGKELVTVGNTVLYKEDGLREVKDFKLPTMIDSDGGPSMIWAKYMVKIANMVGTSKMVIVSSQLGHPIAVFGGNNVYWEVAKNLPKMTRLSIDGKSLYIHRANFIIIDTALL